RMAAWEEDAAPRLNSRDRPVHMARLCRELNRALPADAILVADGGFAGHWTGLLYDTKVPGRHFIPDRGFASIGYGLPGGIGAAMAAPGTPDRRRCRGDPRPRPDAAGGRQPHGRDPPGRPGGVSGARTAEIPAHI